MTDESLWPHLKVNAVGFVVLFVVSMALLGLHHATLAAWFFGAALGWAVRGLVWAAVELHLARKRPRYQGDQR